MHNSDTNLSEREARLIVLAPVGFMINKADDFCCTLCGSRIPHNQDGSVADYEEDTKGQAVCQICHKGLLKEWRTSAS